MAQSILDSLEDLLVGSDEIVRLTTRVKNFNTVSISIVCIILANIPLFASQAQQHQTTSTVSFSAHGTLMHLGTTPFVFASFVHSLWVEKPKPRQGHVLGFLLSLFQSLQWGLFNNTMGALQLVVMSYILLRLISWSEVHGSLSLSTSLIFATASQQLLWTTPLLFLWTSLFIVLVVWLEELAVTLPLTHTKTRHQVSMQLPLLYNSTTALVIYFTGMETLVTLVPSLSFLVSTTLAPHLVVTMPCMLACLLFLDQKLPQLQHTTGKSLVSKWSKQSYALKGWRNEGAARFVQKIIDTNIQWNSLIVFVLWLLGTLIPPSFGITTLFIVVSTVKKWRPENWLL